MENPDVSPETTHEVRMPVSDIQIEKSDAEQMVMALEEKLYKCTHINSHKVRGPIARIMGLVEISRLDKEIDYDWFFEQIKFEVASIDRIIRRVTKELERIEEIKKSEVLKNKTVIED